MTTRKPYRLSDFDFDLPSELIAQVPSPQRSASRLLHVAGARCTDLVFGALPELLAPGDLLVFNDTRVVRSRILGRKPSGGKVELMLERIVAPREAWMQLRASHPPRVGGRIDLPAGASATVCERDERFFRLRFDLPTTLAVYLEQHGAVPLPPYIARAPERRRRGALPDRIRAPPGRGGGADRRAAFRRGVARGTARRGTSGSPTSRCTSAPARSSRWRATTWRNTACTASATAFRRRRWPPSTKRAAAAAHRRRRHDQAARAGSRCSGCRSSRRRRKGDRRSSSRRASAFASSIACSPIFTCPGRRC